MGHSRADMDPAAAERDAKELAATVQEREAAVALRSEMKERGYSQIPGLSIKVLVSCDKCATAVVDMGTHDNFCRARK